MKRKANIKKVLGVHQMKSFKCCESGILAVPAQSRETVRKGDPDMIRFILQMRKQT